jgi:uncharacterized protein (DUF2336 family)
MPQAGRQIADSVMTKPTVTQADVAKRFADSSAQVRVETAEKICAEFVQGGLSDSERAEAERIFHIMAQDVEVRVREALAKNLKECPEIPHDVAVRLAHDVDSVSEAILQFSEALTDRDLVEIVGDCQEAKLLAIAKRKQVSEPVSAALVDSGTEEVVTTLVANEGAQIAEPIFDKVLNDFGDMEPMQDAIAHRPKLPVMVAEHLMARFSDSLREELIEHRQLPAELIVELVLKTREQATVTLSTESDEAGLSDLVRQLREAGRLAPSLILRALCMGELRFFEAAIAELTDLGLVDVRTLIHDAGGQGLRSIYEKAGLPPEYFPVVSAAIDVYRETYYDGGKNDRKRFTRRTIERILTQHEMLDVEIESDDLDYLLKKMNSLPRKFLFSTSDSSLPETPCKSDGAGPPE